MQPRHLGFKLLQWFNVIIDNWTKRMKGDRQFLDNLGRQSNGDFVRVLAQ